MPDDRSWTITELAEQFGVTMRTIRYYEEHGLVSPTRVGRRRVFDDGDRVRLELVLRGRRLGFPLEEIKTIVGMYDEPPGETGQLRYLLEQIAARRTELEARRADIEATLAEMNDVEQRCRADLERLSQERANRPAGR